MSEQEEPQQVDFMIQKIFIKDMSFEAPTGPDMFKSEWQPEANIELSTNSDKLEEHAYEVTLKLTITAKCEDKTAFLVEIQQSGIFTIVGTNEAQLDNLLGAYCPSVLFPYAREAIASAVFRGGFPELNLAPINFDALYQQKAQQEEQTQH